MRLLHNFSGIPFTLSEVVNGEPRTFFSGSSRENFAIEGNFTFSGSNYTSLTVTVYVMVSMRCLMHLNFCHSSF